MIANVTDKTTASNSTQHRTAPVPGTLTPVPGYPKKLCIYKLLASSYWWVRYYTDGKIVRRSTKTENKNEAYRFAKDFYDELNRKRSLGLSISSKSRFDIVVAAMLSAQKAQVARGEVTEITYSNAQYRFNKTILPFFGERDVADLNYELLEKFLEQLSHVTPKLSPATISAYMKLVRKVLNYAFKRQYIVAVPHFPTLKVPDNARGYFTTKEYRLLWSRARALIGNRFDFVKVKNKAGEEEAATYFEMGKAPANARKVRTITLTDELVEMIVFMTNSFIRPTDIKNLQHKHVEILHNDNNYLRLSLPPSKKHDKPIVTMPKAIEVYERLTEKNRARKLGVAPEDYVFLPQCTNRSYALKQLQRQFDVLLWSTKLRKAAKGEDRTIYSLRHSCIMYRLMYGDGMDVVTLAHNARTTHEMIDRFYASQLTGENNIQMIQSRRSRRLKKMAAESA